MKKQLSTFVGSAIVGALAGLVGFTGANLF